MGITENLKYLRQERAGISQKKLAADSGVSFRTIQNIEAGLSDGGAENLAAIAGVLNVSVDRLVGKQEVDIKDLLVTLSALNDTQIRHLLAQAKGMLSADEPLGANRLKSNK